MNEKTEQSILHKQKQCCSVSVCGKLISSHREQNSLSLRHVMNQVSNLIAIGQIVTDNSQPVVLNFNQFMQKKAAKNLNFEI